MDCSQCLEAYNVETRLPKLLPCGHTFCQPCLQRDARCYIENKVFPQTSDGLPDDLHLLRLLEKGMHDKERGKLRLWCDGCKTEAVERCLDNGHKLSSMKKHWHRQALERLQEMKALLEGLVGRQSGAVPAKEAQLCRSGVDVVLDDGADSWTARVQLGGSGEETTLESSALRLLIGEMCAQQRIQEISDTQALQFSTPKPVPFDAVLSADVPRQVGLKSYWFGLFDGSEDDNLSDEEECVIGLIGPETPNVKKADEVDEECLLAGLVVLEMDDEEETSNENTHVPQVRKMTEVSCQANPARTLQALADAAPHLEELQLLNADSAHVLAAHRMPALRRLEACGWFEPFLLPPLEHDGGLEHVKLQLHPITARSLIFAHQQTLRVVRILPFNSRWRELHNIYFEDLDYRGRGRVGDGDSVREGVRRCPYFPHRPPGTFPLLERIEFANFKNPNGPPYNPRWEWIEKLFPGVVLESVFEEKPMYSNKKKFRK